MHRIELAIERTGKARIRHLQRIDARLTVDPNQLFAHIQCIDAAEATDGVEELGGRVDLPRTDCQRQGVLVGDLVRIAQPVAADQLRALGRALHETGHRKPGLLMHPVDGGDRQVVILQRLGDGDLRPVQQLAIQADERLDAEAALGRLQRAILADQRLLLATIEAEQGPVRLFAHIGTRQRTARQIGGHRGQEGIGRGGERQRLECDVTDAIAPVRAVAQIETHVARVGIRQRQPIAPPRTAGHLAHSAPVPAILGRPHGVAIGFQVRQPIDHYTADLAALVQVQADGLLLDATADPERVALAVDHAVLQRGGRIGNHRWHQRRIILRRQALQGQLVEAHRAAATDLAVDRELDGGASCHLLLGRGTPRLVDLAAAVLDRRPRLGEAVAGPVDPPDVVAAGIDQLELQVVARRFATQLESEAVIDRVFDVQRAADADVAGDIVEVIVQAQRAATTGTTDRAQRTADLVGQHQRPGRDVVEVVQHLRCRQRRWCGDRQGSPQQAQSNGDRSLHPLTLPSNRPWM